MKEEILIRVESLKIELDETYSRISDQIDTEKVKAKGYVNVVSNQINCSLHSANQFVKTFDQVKNNQETVYSCEDRLLQLDNLEYDLTRSIQSVKFMPKEEKIPENMLGDLKITTLAELKNSKSKL
jgi:hypothetical protein